MSQMMGAKATPPYVVKRDGRRQPLDVSQVVGRLKTLASRRPALKEIDVGKVSAVMTTELPSGISTQRIDVVTAHACRGMLMSSPDYPILAARIILDNMTKQSPKTFSECMECVHQTTRTPRGEPYPQNGMLDTGFMVFVRRNRKVLDDMIDHRRNNNFDNIVSAMMWYTKYCFRLQNESMPLECPQYTLMREALSVEINRPGEAHRDDYILRATQVAYDAMSRNKHFTHATPTIFHAGKTDGLAQLSSCFLLTMNDDSIEGIYKTLTDCALISKGTGGIGFSVHNIRAAGSVIQSSKRMSAGLLPMLQVFNATARYVDQNRLRPGAFASYVEPWHADIVAWLDLRSPHGDANTKALDLFYALWIPDLFMKRVENDAMWTLMSPDRCPGLSDCWGDEFEILYVRYEQENKGVRTVRARDVWNSILASQQETGMPYMLYKDACNRKSNQQNLGTIHSSNLCAEMVLFHNAQETAVCNLGALNLVSFVNARGRFRFSQLYRFARLLARRLDRVIDITSYPTEEARESNMRHRPIAMGVMGFADTLVKMGIVYHSEETLALAHKIFSVIYYAAITESHHQATISGHYETFEGSPMSKGLFQFDMWNDDVVGLSNVEDANGEPFRMNWDILRRGIMRDGIRNSEVTAIMPTVSTSALLGVNENVEPFSDVVFKKETGSGDFTVMNRLFVDSLRQASSDGKIDRSVTLRIIQNRGNIQNVDGVPQRLQDLYCSVWDIKQRFVIDLSVLIGHFVSMSQSMNLHFKNPTSAQLSSAHFYGWKKGLKTGSYYIRSRAAVEAVNTAVRSLGAMDVSDDVSPESLHACNLDGGHCDSCD